MPEGFGTGLVVLWLGLACVTCGSGHGLTNPLELACYGGSVSVPLTIYW